MFGTLVSDMQDNITIVAPTATEDGKISGTLYKQTDENSALVSHWGEGYFLSLKFNSSDWSNYDSVEVGLDPSQSSGLVDILSDPDKNGAFKITSPSVQKFKVVATKGSETITKYYEFTDDLQGLTDKEDPTSVDLGFM